MTLTKMDEPTIPVGASKYGGSPDLPAGFEWPTCVVRPGYKPEGARYPLTFVAQFNFAEAASCLQEDPIWPSDGVLAIFFDGVCSPSGQIPEEAPGLRLFYFPTAARLQRTPAPQGQLPTPSNASKVSLQPRLIQFAPAWSVPGEESLELMRGGKEVKIRWSERNEDGEPPECRHRLGGFALPEQYDPREGCRDRTAAWVKTGTRASGDRQPPRPVEVDGPWRLLVQFDFSADPEIACAYEGTQFYVCVSRESIRSKSFAAAWWEWDQD